MLSSLVAAVSVILLTGVDVQREMEALIAEMDSGAYAKAVSAPEQIVLAYERAQGRAPTANEFHTSLGLWSELKLKPSDLLSFAIRGGEPEITWEMCARFLARKSGMAAPSARSKAIAEALLQTPLELPFQAAPVERATAVKSGKAGLAYNTYFGYLHAHSELSDGTGTPDEAYAGARAAGLDFFALTDHGELLLLWPWQHKWEQEKAAADAADAPGEFAALWGFEWSSPLFGHVTIVNSADYTDCLTSFRIAEMYDWLTARPEAFGQFNHPGYFDYAVADLMHFRLCPAAVEQMVGVELWNDRQGFDTYYYGGNWDGPESFLDAANLKGWRIGALGGEDNHNADWGLTGQFRTGVLATDLTRDAIADAYRNRRFYATEDGNLCLDFRCGGYPMGSVLDDEARVFNVTAHDRDGEEFEEVRVYRNGELIETRAVEGPDLFETFTDDWTDDAYYYAIVKQRDDSDENGRNDEAISSPIWFETSNGAPSGCYGARGREKTASAGLSNLLVLGLLAGTLLRCGRGSAGQKSKPAR